MIIQALLVESRVKGCRKGMSLWGRVLVVGCRDGSFPSLFDRFSLGFAT